LLQVVAQAVVKQTQVAAVLVDYWLLLLNL
jgi:hypothetical protein